MGKEMGSDQPPVKKSKRKIFTVILLLLFMVVYLVYYNFNRLLSEALMKSFNSGSISEIYELKFEKLNVNLVLGNIRVSNVELVPRIKPLHSYPYINTSFSLKTNKILLENVEIFNLLKSNILKLEKIEIIEPDVELTITDKIPILFPLKDTTGAVQVEKNKKKSIESFSLKSFELADASFHVINSAKQREFRIQKLSVLLNDLFIDQRPGKDIISYSHIDFSIGKAEGKIQKEAIKYVGFNNFKIGFDSIEIEKSIDTLIYHFTDFNARIADVDIQTADSIFHLTMDSFNLSYRNKLIKLSGISFKPNITNTEMQKRFKYQHTDFAAVIGSLSINNLNFDSIIYGGKIFIDEIKLDNVTAEIYKDNTKPVDSSRIPIYFGQQINAISLPLSIKQVTATNVNLVNTERKPDGDFGIAHVNRGTIIVKNITNNQTVDVLTMNAEAFIENKAHVNLKLGFSYKRPEFSFNGKVDKFNLADLNKLIQSYVPAKINKGIADEITFSGTIFRTNSTGTMKFLYHDLDVDIALKEKAKWKSSVIAFAANTAVQSSNPGSKDEPPRIVKFQAERKMNKGFINIIIKSVLSGIKETMFMSKENRKAHNEAKKKAKQKN